MATYYIGADVHSNNTELAILSRCHHLKTLTFLSFKAFINSTTNIVHRRMFWLFRPSYTRRGFSSETDYVFTISKNHNTIIAVSIYETRMFLCLMKNAS